MSHDTRRVAYVYLPRFPLQRLVVEQPSFSGKPVVLLEEIRGAHRVRFVSRAASTQGVRAGQTGAAASATCPGLLKRPFNADDELKALESLGESLLVMSPAFELDSPDGLWLDASAAHLSGGESAWAKELVERCGKAGLRARVMVGSERFSTQALARFGEEGVLPAQGGPRLASTPLDSLSCAGMGSDVLDPLKALGLTTLGEVASLPQGSLAARFGARGHLVAQLSRGADDSRLKPHALPERIDESIALDWPAEQLEPVLFAIKMVVDRVCARLQGRQRAAVRLAVGLVLEGTPTTALPVVLARPSSQSKLLVELLRHRLTDLSVRHPIVGVRVAVEEDCAEPGRQLRLGDAPAGDAQLEVVLAKLQSALGEASLFSAEPVARHQPETAWRLTPFRPPDSGRLSEWWGAVEAGWTLGEKAPELQDESWAVVDRQRTNEQLALLSCAKHVDDAEPNQSEGSSKKNEWSGPTGRAAPGPQEAEVMDVVAGLELGMKWKTAKAKAVPVPPLMTVALESRPSRLFREPAVLHAERSEKGLISFVTLQGRRRRVESVEGPERLVGQWWSADSSGRDYYRLRVEGVGLLWVFKNAADGRFYAHGVFD